MDEPSEQETAAAVAALQSFGQTALDLEKSLAETRAKQKDLVLYLYRHTDISLARVSVIASVHRLTVFRWVKAAKAQKVNPTHRGE